MRKLPVLSVFFLLLVLSGIAQRRPLAVKDEITPVYDSIFSSLKWRNIGPFRGGRSNAVTGVTGNDQLYYAGYTGGGIWRTDDAGITWKNISDGQFSTSTIGDIAVSASDPNVIYVGTGEHAVRGVMTSFGDGVYKSLNGGRTWKHIGLSNTRHISDVVIHPSNADIVFVAAQGALHGNNSERGLFKSADGGLTWKKTLYINDSTGISSLVIDVTNPRILYAASWQHRRLPWTVLSGGEGCGIWKSEDGGENWKKINNGLPKEMGKIGVAVSKADPSRVFAIVEAEKSKAGVYRSDDGGRTWNHLSSNQDLTARSWYYMEVFTDPVNEDLVYVLNAPMMKSIDGGKTWTRIRVGHGDTHDLWINPSDPKNMILGDDGGAEITFNGGQTWSTQMNQPTAQFYRVNTDNKFPYKVYGGQQDNTSVIIKSRTNSGAIDVTDWMVGAGCECAYQAFDPNDPTHVYGGCYQGYIEVLDVVTREGKDIQAYPSLNLAVEPKKMKYRFNWNAPIVASPHDPKTIYHAGNVVLRTTNGGIKWEQISGDLTRNDSTKQGSGGGPMTNEGAGGENYNTIMYLIESTLEKGVIWTGSDCGLVHLTTDGGRSWKNVTPAGLPECLINSIEVSPHDKGVAYVAATRYKFNDFGSYAFKTTDYGKTWVKINTGIHTDDFLRVIREDPKRKGFLYGGGERGFYISDNGGSNWQKMQLNLPNVPVTDLTFRDNDLVASTAGRAFWILDDLSSLQQFTYAKSLTLFKPKPAYKYGSGSLPGKTNPYVGTNAPGGVILDYYMPEDADTNDVKLEIINDAGKLVRAYSNKKDPDYTSYPGGPEPKMIIPASKGINRFLWDLRGEQVQDVKGVFIYGDYRGNSLAPGNYKARISYKDTRAETEINVLADPNIKVDAAAWKEQQQVLERIDKSITEMHVAVNSIRKARKQVQDLNDNLKDIPQYKSLLDEGNSLVKAMEDWEKKIVEGRITNGQDVINWPSKLNAEFFNIRSIANAHDPRITYGVRTRLADLEAEWSILKMQYETNLRNSVNAFNKKYQEAGVPAIMMK